ncbi:zinc finger protein 862-like [Aphis craccivora]|uniref:Zinc finger protein 862-like n=1 Tax=Aphis craccivora TaxID=307492 RepID=A0A6G0VNL8_APHCR|nr:zinc finger protein 862-like [Aphis craccivora]
MKDGNDKLIYPLLTTFVSVLLILPHSSACVERIFSTINLNKTKTRNRLSTESLSVCLYSDDIQCIFYNIVFVLPSLVK